MERKIKTLIPLKPFGSEEFCCRKQWKHDNYFAFINIWVAPPKQGQLMCKAVSYFSTAMELAKELLNTNSFWQEPCKLTPHNYLWNFPKDRLQPWQILYTSRSTEKATVYCIILSVSGMYNGYWRQTIFRPRYSRSGGDLCSKCAVGDCSKDLMLAL